MDESSSGLSSNMKRAALQSHNEKKQRNQNLGVILDNVNQNDGNWETAKNPYKPQKTKGPKEHRD